MWKLDALVSSSIKTNECEAEKYITREGETEKETKSATIQSVLLIAKQKEIWKDKCLNQVDYTVYSLSTAKVQVR